MVSTNRRSLLAALCLLGLLPGVASSDPLVRPGDLLVGVGNGVFVVRTDDGEVLPFSPREGSGANLLQAAGDVLVDVANQRVFVTDLAAGLLILIDPETGGQTIVTDDKGSTLDLGSVPNGLARALQDDLIVASFSLLPDPPNPFPITRGFLFLVSGPSANGVAAATPFAALGDPGLPPEVATAEPASDGLQIVTSGLTSLAGAIATVDPGTGEVTAVPGTPQQQGLQILDVDVVCPTDLASDCLRYWIESSGSCAPEDAAVYRATTGGDITPLYLGAPLQCAASLQPDGPGTFYVGNLETGGPGPEAFFYRFDEDAQSGLFVPTMLTQPGDFPALSMSFPSLTVSPISLPEPAATLLAATTCLALGLIPSDSRRRGRSAAVGAGRPNRRSVAPLGAQRRLDRESAPRRPLRGRLHRARPRRPAIPGTRRLRPAGSGTKREFGAASPWVHERGVVGDPLPPAFSFATATGAGSRRPVRGDPRSPRRPGA